MQIRNLGFGSQPQIALDFGTGVTAEPLPSRLASVALGTGDLDCVYHTALDELSTAVSSGHDEEASNMLRILVEGKRLKDISDLPLDLAL